MKLFSEIIETIKALKGFENDYQVAEILGIKPKSMATLKTRNSIPYEELTSLCNIEGISLNWLLTNNGPKTLSTTSAAAPQTSEYQVEKIKISEDIYLATRVLESGTGYATALHLNIRSFAEAVDEKERMAALEHNQRDFEKQVREEIQNLKNDFNSLKSENETLRMENKKLRDLNGGCAPINLSPDNAALTGSDNKET